MHPKVSQVFRLGRQIENLDYPLTSVADTKQENSGDNRMKIDYTNSASVLSAADEYRENSIVLRNMIEILLDDNAALRKWKKERIELLKCHNCGGAFPVGELHPDSAMDDAAALCECCLKELEETSKWRKGRCQLCGANLVDDCRRCGAPQCCPQCCRHEEMIRLVAALENKFAKWKILKTSDKMPEPYKMVIVSGGVAVWTGSEWLSRTGEDNGRKIEWDVKWWMAPLFDEDVVESTP
jgi:hypothetical protein